MTLRALVSAGAERITAAGAYLGQGTATSEDEALEIALGALDLDYDVPESILDESLDPDQVEPSNLVDWNRPEAGWCRGGEDEACYEP